MGPGLQLLAITSAAQVASQIGGAARGAAQNFAELFSPQSEPPSEAVGDASQPPAASLIDRIQSAIAGHLERLGLSRGTSLQIEVQESGQMTVHADSTHRLELEDAITQDDELVEMLTDYAHAHSSGTDSYFVHWPPLEAADMIGR